MNRIEFFLQTPMLLAVFLVGGKGQFSFKLRVTLERLLETDSE